MSHPHSSREYIADCTSKPQKAIGVFFTSTPWKSLIDRNRRFLFSVYNCLARHYHFCNIIASIAIDLINVVAGNERAVNCPASSRDLVGHELT